MKIQRVPIRGTRSIVNTWGALTLLGALGTAQAAIFKDAQLESLQDTGEYVELETTVRSSQPETARIIRVHIAGEAKNWAEMEAELLAIKPGKDGAMLAEVRGATMQLALVFFKDAEDLAKAKSLYESLQRDQPSRAAGFYGAARVQAALGQPDEAIRLFERAKTLNGADEFPIDHRLGDTLLAKGDKAQAKAVYERFIANKRSRPANVEDVRKSLARLG